MRTTLDLDDHLMQRLKRQAQARGVSLTREIEETLARGLEQVPSRPAQPHRFRVFQGTQALPVDVADRDALEAFLEER